MPQFKLRAKDKKAIEAIQEAYEKTVILQRQKSVTYGRWDFAVFAEAGKEETILRVGYAEHSVIQRAPLYIASLAQPGLMDVSGIPIEEFITEDVPEEYQGLEIIQVDPVRTVDDSGKEDPSPYRHIRGQNMQGIRGSKHRGHPGPARKRLGDCRDEISQ